MADIKFCGLTRREDAEYAAELGAAYVGAIFAGGPRLISPERAAELFVSLPASVRRVGVFGDQTVEDVCETARIVGLDVVQMHGHADRARLEAIRSCFEGEVWGVLRVKGTLPPDASELFDASDALVLDALVPGALGGTGVTIEWSALAVDVRALRERQGRRTQVILAGGLRPENVVEAIGVLAPDVVDVSSGVESAPGIKDHDRMRAFRDAVMATGARFPR